MARLIIPGDFISQVTLLANIVAQNDSPGTNNPLSAFLTQQNIVLSDDVAAGNAAKAHETSRNLFGKQSENYRQLRDSHFKTPWNHITGSAQFLKQFYKGNTKELGNWGFTITDSGKINYPAAFNDRAALCATFIKKNESYAPAGNPLLPYLTQQNIDVTADAGLISQSVTSDTSFTAAAQQSENETQLRNQLWLPVVAHIRIIGSFLMKLYRNNPKAAGAWGFVVDDSPKKPKLRTTKLRLGGRITNKSVVIGSTLTNTGGSKLHLYRGSSTAGTPVILDRDEQFGIRKGYGTITVVNPSTLMEGKFTVMVSSS